MSDENKPAKIRPPVALTEDELLLIIYALGLASGMLMRREEGLIQSSQALSTANRLRDIALKLQ